MPRGGFGDLVEMKTHTHTMKCHKLNPECVLWKDTLLLLLWPLLSFLAVVFETESSA